MLFRRVAKFQKRRPNTRKHLSKGNFGIYTAESAQAEIKARDAKEAKKEYDRQKRAAIKKEKKEAKNNLRALGVHARRIEQLHKREVKILLPNNIRAAYLFVPIPNLETEARLAYKATLTRFQLPAKGL